MANLDTKTKVIGDMTVTLSKEKGGAASAFDRVVAGLKFLGRAVTDPGYGISSDRPDQSLPGAQPGVDNTLPGGGRPDQSLPDAERPSDPNYGINAPATPDQGLPPTATTKPGSPAGQPDQSLPGAKLGAFLQENADEIARVILKGTACDPAQPKR